MDGLSDAFVNNVLDMRMIQELDGSADANVIGGAVMGASNSHVYRYRC
jgi:hypothetical protein